MSFFQPEWESPDYIQYDPERANEILDSLGLTERDDEGFRLRRDGGGSAEHISKHYHCGIGPRTRW